MCTGLGREEEMDPFPKDCRGGIKCQPPRGMSPVKIAREGHGLRGGPEPKVEPGFCHIEPRPILGQCHTSSLTAAQPGPGRRHQICKFVVTVKVYCTMETAAPNLIQTISCRCLCYEVLFDPQRNGFWCKQLYMCLSELQ